jgi:hypothetical protein
MRAPFKARWQCPAPRWPSWPSPSRRGSTRIPGTEVLESEDSRAAGGADSDDPVGGSAVADLAVTCEVTILLPFLPQLYTVPDPSFKMDENHEIVSSESAEVLKWQRPY